MAGTRERVEWVDIAKGAAILLVVVHHTVLFFDGHGWLPGAVVTVNSQLSTFRMPLFFLASGFFAGRPLSSPWSVVLRRRVLLFAHLYVLWVLVRFAFFRIVPNAVNPEEGHHPVDLLVSLVVPQTGLWFLYALAVFSVLTKALWRLPVPVQLGLAALLSAAVGGRLLELGSFAWSSMAMYFVFFLLGCRARPSIESLVHRLTPGRAVVLAGAYVVVAVAVVRLDLVLVPGVRLATSLLAVSAGVSLAVLVSGRGVGRPLRTLGRRTIDVYLPHVMVIGGLTAGLAGLGELSVGVGASLVPVVSAGAVAGSLALSAGLRRAGLAWAFAPPRWLGGAGDRSPALLAS